MIEQRPLTERVREELLLNHVGQAQGITCEALARAVGATARPVRQAIAELREAGVPICGHPATGYFIAQTHGELETTCRFLRGRALHSLTLESRLRRTPLPELVGQLRLELKGT